MSCMCSTKLCVPAGVLAHWIAGDVPSPGATPGAAWLNLTGIWPPSGYPAIVSVITGAAPPAFCATAETVNPSMISPTDVSRMGYILSRIPALRPPKAESFDSVYRTAYNSRERLPESTMLKPITHTSMLAVLAILAVSSLCAQPAPGQAAPAGRGGRGGRGSAIPDPNVNQFRTIDGVKY